MSVFSSWWARDENEGRTPLLTPDSSSDDGDGYWDTNLLDGSGNENYVGTLLLQDSPENPEGREYCMSTEPYVFLSQTGRDNTREHIARPTHWFLKNVVGVEAFFDAGDDESMDSVGKLVALNLLRQAYRCTHALVFLSPKFRTRPYCVKELNTFMRRLKNKDGICLLPVCVVGMDNLNGFHPKLDRLTWLNPRETENATDFLVQILWPALLRKFKKPTLSRDVLEGHLHSYALYLRGGPSTVPSFLDTFVIRYELSRQATRVREVYEQEIVNGYETKTSTVLRLFNDFIDVNVRSARLHCPPQVDSINLDSIVFTDRMLRGAHMKEAEVGAASLKVGGIASQVYLKIIKFPPPGEITKPMKDGPIRTPRGRDLPYVVLLLGEGCYDMRLVSSFREVHDVVLIVDEHGDLQQPTIPDIRVRCLYGITWRIWVATAININGYCVSHIPEGWAPWIGFASLLLSITLAAPFPLAPGAGRTTNASVETLDPWKIVGGDRTLHLDVLVLAIFMVFGLWSATMAKNPTSLLDGLKLYGHHIVLCMYYKFWWYLIVPLEKAKALVPLFSSGAVLAGTLLTMVVSPRMVMTLVLGVITVFFVSTGFVQALDQSPRSILLSSTAFLTIPLAVMFLVLQSIEDDFANMVKDGKFYDVPEAVGSRLTAVSVGLLVVIIKVKHVKKEMLNVSSNVLQPRRDSGEGWGAFMFRPAPSRISVGSGDVRLDLGHRTSRSQPVQLASGQYQLGAGLYQ